MQQYQTKKEKKRLFRKNNRFPIANYKKKETRFNCDNKSLMLDFVDIKDINDTQRKFNEFTPNIDLLNNNQITIPQTMNSLLPLYNDSKLRVIDAAQLIQNVCV